MDKPTIYFTKGMFATDEENEAINALRSEGKVVNIQNGSAHQPGGKLRDFDSVEGEVPSEYQEVANDVAAREAAGDLAALNDLDEESEEGEDLEGE